MTPRRTVTLVGLGLIGGSIAASLKARRTRWVVTGTDRRQGSVDLARQRGFLDEGYAEAAEAVTGADLVILAAPVRAIRSLLCQLAPHLRPGQVVTDVGSAKVSVLVGARECLPEGVAFVGGHPVAGTERGGIEGAVPGLFEGRTCVLTPEPDTPPEALELVSALWRDLGSEVVCIAPDLHDRVFAYVSHLPHALAYSLVGAVSSDLEPHQASLGGTSLRDFTRVTASPAAVWKDVFLENRAALLGAVDAFSALLAELRSAVEAGDEEALDRFFLRAASEGRNPWHR